MRYRSGVFSGVTRVAVVFAVLLISAASVRTAHAQLDFLRDSLERLDRNNDDKIHPREITPLARAYLERIAVRQGLRLDRTNTIDRIVDAAKAYNAARSREAVQPEDYGTIKPFGHDPQKPLIPGFGLGDIRFPYIQRDIDNANSTLRSYDRDRNGFIDRAEASRTRWSRPDPFEFDFDGDERLDQMELGQRFAHARLRSQSRSAIARRDRNQNFRDRWQWSADRDRRSTSGRRRERSLYYLTTPVLRRFDVNQNGRLEMAEVQTLGLPTDQIDVDRDGEISRSELDDYLTALQEAAGDPSMGLPGWFYELDANEDGQIAMSEFSVEWTQTKLEDFKRLDLNGDGLLTEAELAQSRSMVGGGYFNETAEVLTPGRTVISEIVIDDEDYIIGDLNVQVSITHTSTGQLDAFLTGPDGQRIELFTEVGGGGDNFDNTIFDDQASRPVTKTSPPFRGEILPEAKVKNQTSLDYFRGKSVAGVWQLVVRATRSERFGMLHNWGLIVRPEDNMLDPAQPESEPSAAEGEDAETPADTAG